ncbi:MAG: hypothetical protein ACT4PV_03555 [Planctomycetaceae bacterium]
MPVPPASLLRTLARVKAEYGGGVAARKRELLDALARAALPTARAVERLHEVLCFLRAYPDDAAVLARVERMLARFSARRDLRRHADALADSGIAGTRIAYPFFQGTAEWLARRWPGRLRVDWDAFERGERLEAVLHLLAHYSETPGLDEYAFSMEEWTDKLKGRRETGAAFLVRRFAALAADPLVGEAIYEDLDLPLLLDPGPDTPARTRAHVPVGPVVFQNAPLRRGRPDLRAAILRPPRSVRAVSPRDGRRLIDLARESMVTRSRDLDVFMHGDPRDVRLVDCGDGLQFAAIGFLPGRRLMFEAVYGFLTLKNGVPIGYVLNSALFGSAEIAYNIFETFRGAEAAAVYGQVLATVRHLFGADSFTIYPYQLGHDNDEGLRSGAWWFYRKLGFYARDPAVARLVRKEEARLRRKPEARSSLATLRKLAAENLYFDLGPRREDVIGVLPMADAGLAISKSLARRAGADREGAERACAREAASLLGVRSLRGWTQGERLWWRRWAPFVVALPGVARWPARDRRALAAVVRSKGGPRESDFVRRFDAHARLRRALLALARRGAEA